MQNQEKIVTIKGSVLTCNCGCGKTYDRQEFVDHYQEDVLPVSLTAFAQSDDEFELLRDVVDPRNLKIV